MLYSKDNSNNIGDRVRAQENVLTTEETCQILNRTRQQLLSFVKKGEIEVLKQTSNSNLFWRPDVYAFLKKKNKERTSIHHEILGYSTGKSLSYFQDLNLNPNEVEEIYVFLNNKDAIEKGFYNLREVEMPDTLTNIEAARFIITMKDETEYWFQGFTCGYRGEGCYGTEEVLSRLGVLPKGTDGINPIISDNKILHFFRENEEWVYTGEESNEELKKQSEESDFMLDIEAHHYRYNGTLVLTQGLRHMHETDNTLLTSRDFLLKSFYFTPNPATIEFLTKEEALSTGHYQTWYHETILYQIIVKDLSGCELWISYPMEEILKYQPKTMRDLFNILGIEIEDKVPEVIRHFLSLSPRKIFNKHAVKRIPKQEQE